MSLGSHIQSGHCLCVFLLYFILPRRKLKYLHSSVSVRALSDVNYPACSSVVSLFSGGENDSFRYLERTRYDCVRNYFNDKKFPRYLGRRFPKFGTDMCLFSWKTNISKGYASPIKVF